MTYLISKFLRSAGSLKSINVGKSKIMFLPSSMIGVRQYAQLTLQGSLWTQVFSELSYQPRSWWPWVKLMSSLWKMAAHWNGAPDTDVNASHPIERRGEVPCIF